VWFFCVISMMTFCLPNTTAAFGVQSTSDLSRSQFLVAMGGLVAGVGLACAKDSVHALKGTKKDPAFEQCISFSTIYDCTKTKGSEQKSRADCVNLVKRQVQSSETDPSSAGG
jgi:hypothetical protein